MLVKHDVNIQALILQGEGVKFAILSLVRMGHREEHMESRMEVKTNA
jgi:hypothetical protein